ncbi:MAG: LLM class flavin-dependent oxidoreductase, partial [Burkholderiaceae bacterium]
MNKPTPMHLTLSLAGQGYHAAALAASSSAAAGADSVPSYRSLVQKAQAAGFDSVFMTAPPAGSAAPHLDTMPLLGTLVAPTGRIGLGATVDVAHTEPFHTARAFAVLDNLSGGRTAWLVDLSLPPPGDADFAHRPVLDAAAHYQRAEEYIEVAMKLWDSWEDDAVVTDKAAGVFADDRRIHPIHHRGTHFTVRGPLTAVRPLQGHPVLVFD